MTDLGRTGGAPRESQSRLSVSRSQTLGSTYVRESVVEWAKRRPMLIAPGLVGAAVLLLLAGYPRGRVLGAGIAYALLVAVQMATAARARKASLDDRLLFVTWLADVLCHGAAVGFTGGLTSPLCPALLGAALRGLGLFGRGRMNTICFGVVIASTLALALLPARVAGPPVAAPYASAIAAIAILYVAALVRARALSLNDAYQRAGATRDKLREDILHAVTVRARSLESISAKVAHELKNPLSAIKGLVQLLARGSSEEKMRERIQVITSEVTRMELILRDYLSFSRPLEDLRPEPVDLGALADDVLAVLEARAESGRVRVERGGAGASVIADPRRLKEALLNVVANAIEATGEGGSVHVDVDPGGVAEGDRLMPAGGAVIRVRDTGRGIAPEALAKLGTPFFTTREGGTGLGVVLARAVIVQHGGEIHYASELGRGTAVTVSLPPKPKVYSSAQVEKASAGPRASGGGDEGRGAASGASGAEGRE